MKIIENPKCIFFDCDDTLVMWEPSLIKEDDNGKRNSILIPNPDFGPSMYTPSVPFWELVPHERHIQYLKDAKIKNKNTIVVWSAGGWDWAHNVVVALGLEEYVDAVMAKPDFYVDDLPCKEFMGLRIYKDMK